MPREELSERDKGQRRGVESEGRVLFSYSISHMVACKSYRGIFSKFRFTASLRVCFLISTIPATCSIKSILGKSKSHVDIYVFYIITKNISR